MRTAIVTLAACGLIALSAAANDSSKKDKDPVAREIDLKGFKAERPKAAFPNPTKITTAEELAKAIADKEWQERILKQVDFAKEQLVFFAWAASGGDKLSFKVEEEKNEPVVVFTHTGGATDDLRSHFHLYAVAKTAKWRF
jgi:hypothetical protein